MMALLLISFVLVCMLGFLGTRSLEFSNTGRLQQMALAQSLAEAGMEDARVKLEKDMFFPPLQGFGQNNFIYSEDLMDPETGQLAGSYVVTVDHSLRGSPHCVVRLQSVGTAGPRQNPRARYRIYAEIDVSSHERATNAVGNPRLYRYILWREGDVEQPAGLPLPE